jgi:hypothetical protein
VRFIKRRVVMVALLVVLLPGGVRTGSAATPVLSPAHPRAPVPGTTCSVLPANDVWNTRINKLPVNANSDAWLDTMAAATTNLHPDFGRPPYGLPFAVVDNSHATESVTFHYANESDPGPYPFGPDIPLEGGSDRHALMINKDTCVLYELFAANWNNGDPKAGSGAVWNLGSNHLRPDTWTSADAAGLPIFPGLVRYDEVQAGQIDHAIRFTAELTDCNNIWPARHDAGTCNPAYPPMGARFRLKPGFDLSGFTAQARVILKAMKLYGMVLADNGTNWYFQGTEDNLWSDDLLDQLKSVPARAFEAVEESACQVKPNSGKATCPSP